MNTILPENYQDICPSIRVELEDAFQTYWEEQNLEGYMRAIYEDFDSVTLEEIEQESKEFIDNYLLDKLQDEM